MKHIAIKIATTIIIASLHFPVLYNYIHLFVNNNHTTCEEYSKCHIHKKDIECYLFNTLKLNNQISFIPDSFKLFIPNNTAEEPVNFYFFTTKTISLYFLRRGPPVFS